MLTLILLISLLQPVDWEAACWAVGRSDHKGPVVQVCLTYLSAIWERQHEEALRGRVEDEYERL